MRLVKKNKRIILDNFLYKEPLPVQEYISRFNNDIFALCPRCNNVLEREFQNFCSSCGQRLFWYSDFKRIKIIKL